MKSQSLSLQLFQPLIFPVIFIIPAFLMVALAAYAAGGTTLACQRVESTQIDCTLSNRSWWGLVDTGDTQLKGLQGAHTESYPCTSTDSHGREIPRQCHSLALDTATGKVYAALLATSLDEITKADEINKFIASRETTTLTMDNNQWKFSAAVSGFALIWFGVGYFVRGQIKAFK
jgi:hypothetical protein